MVALSARRLVCSAMAVMSFRTSRCAPRRWRARGCAHRCVAPAPPPHRQCGSIPHLAADLVDGGGQFVGGRRHRLHVGRGLLGGRGDGGRQRARALRRVGQRGRRGLQMRGGVGNRRHDAAEGRANPIEGLALRLDAGIEIDRDGEIHIQQGGGDDRLDQPRLPFGRRSVEATGLEAGLDGGDEAAQKKGIARNVPAGLKAETGMCLADAGDGFHIGGIEPAIEDHAPVLDLHRLGVGAHGGRGEHPGHVRIGHQVVVEAIQDLRHRGDHQIARLAQAGLKGLVHADEIQTLAQTFLCHGTIPFRGTRWCGEFLPVRTRKSWRRVRSARTFFLTGAHAVRPRFREDGVACVIHR